MPLTFSFPFVDTPAFYTGTSLSSLVPDVFPVAINGRPYLVDQRSNQFSRTFEQRVRDSVDQSTAPGEAAINPGGLWRRGEVSWHLGAGQKYADTAEGQDYRFYKSKGVNPWVRGQLSLLNSTKSALTTSSTNLMTCVVKSGGVEYVYVADGSVVKWCPATGANNIFSSSPTWTPINTAASGTLPTTTVTGLETNGSNVFIAWENNDIWSSSPGTQTATFFYAKNPDNGRTYYAFGYAKGRGWAAHGANIHQPAVSSPTHSIYYGPSSPAYDPNRVWVGFAGGQNAVYAASYIGDKTTIFKITIKADGTLDVPVAALELPTGEVASSIHGYLGAILIGSNKGVRYCTTDSNSNLVAGALIPTSGPVYDFNADDRFVYFTWSNYDGSSGLGRLDLSVFITTNTPAHASDLMYNSSTADVKSVSTAANKRIFTISGVGVIVEDTANLVTEGYIESGIYRWGIPDRKFIARVDTRSTPLVGSIASYMSLDASEYALLGTWSGSNDTENSFNGSDDHAIEAQFKFVLNRATATTGPTFTRWAARAYAAPYRSEVFRIPVLLHEMLRVHDKDYYFDVNEELGALRELINKPRIVTLQVRDETVSVIVEDLEWTPIDAVDKDWLWQGTATVTMRSVQE